MSLSDTLPARGVPAGEEADGVSFAIEYEHRASDKLTRNEVIDIFANAVPKPPNKVNLKTPEKTILVQCIRNVCAVAVVASYKELQRFNVRKLAEADDDEEQQQQDEGDKKEHQQLQPKQQLEQPEQQEAAAEGQANHESAEQPAEES